MIWQSTADFWRMGGYGLYVWGSFGVSLLLLLAETMLLRRRRRRLLAALAERHADGTPGGEGA